MIRRQHRGFFTAGPQTERDTLTCGHCQRIIVVPPGTGVSTPVPFCRSCMSYICTGCNTIASCTPWEKRLEAMESRARLLRDIGVG